MSAVELNLSRSYWEVLKSLSDDVKLHLASMLTSSVLENRQKSKTVENKELVLQDCFGAWSMDETEYPVSKMIDDINEMSKDSKDFIQTLL